MTTFDSRTNGISFFVIFQSRDIQKKVREPPKRVAGIPWNTLGRPPQNPWTPCGNSPPVEISSCVSVIDYKLLFSSFTSFVFSASCQYLPKGLVIFNSSSESSNIGKISHLGWVFVLRSTSPFFLLL